MSGHWTTGCQTKKGIIKTKNNKTTKLDWLIENWLALDDLKDEVDMGNDVEQGHCRATGSPLLRGFCRTPGISWLTRLWRHQLCAKSNCRALLPKSWLRMHLHSSLCAYNLPEKTKKKKPTQSSVTAMAGSHGYFENKDYFDKFEYIGWLGLWGCANWRQPMISGSSSMSPIH